MSSRSHVEERNVNRNFSYRFCGNNGSASSRSPVLLRVMIAFVAGAFVFALTGALAQNQTPGGTRPAAAPTGNADSGKRLYVADGCYECHGYVGQGGSGSGPKLGPHPILFSAFVAQIRHPTEEMPPYTSKVVSDADLADIYAFLQSVPEPPKVDNVPLLK
jgi:mono/diheme cytochrome c family protein